MINDYVKHFSYDELVVTLYILHAIKDGCITKREMEKHQLSEMKYKYWLMISENRNYENVIIGGN